jgi:hypothetical protein
MEVQQSMETTHSILIADWAEMKAFLILILSLYFHVGDLCSFSKIVPIRSLVRPLVWPLPKRLQKCQMMETQTDVLLCYSPHYPALSDSKEKTQRNEAI